MKGFWKKIAKKAREEKRPILASASMANVTDAAFRRMIAKYGKPDVIWTEFVSCDGVCHFDGEPADAKAMAGKEKLMHDLIFDKSEHPIVVQFFGAKPENFYKCALMARELGFDGIDINMGCPDRGVIRQGAGSALIKNPKLAQEIIKETIRGAGKLPVSVKTRIGFNETEHKEWIPYLLKMDISALTIHGRTKKEMSDVPACWNVIGEIVKMRNKLKSKTLIIGNGDVLSLADAQEKYDKYGVDGVMVGRALFGTPYFFDSKTFLYPRLRQGSDEQEGYGGQRKITLKFKLKLALEHTKLFEKIFVNGKHFDLVRSRSPRGGRSHSLKARAASNGVDIMKKHYKAYVSGFDNAKKIRMRLMNVKSLDSAEKTLKKLISEA